MPAPRLLRSAIQQNVAAAAASSGHHEGGYDMAPMPPMHPTAPTAVRPHHSYRGGSDSTNRFAATAASPSITSMDHSSKDTNPDTRSAAPPTKMRTAAGTRQFTRLSDLAGPRACEPPRPRVRTATVIPGRESNTTNMYAFDALFRQLKRATRESSDPPLHVIFWEKLTQMLATFREPLGLQALPSPDQSLPVDQDMLDKYLRRVLEQITCLVPLCPDELAKRFSIPEETIINELLLATRVGLVTARFATECVTCKGDLAPCERIADVRRLTERCQFCNSETSVSSFERIKLRLFLNEDILYFPMMQQPCRVTTAAQAITKVMAGFPATESGSGFTFAMDPPLPKGEYFMRCRIAGVERKLVVLDDATPDTRPYDLHLRVSQLQDENKTEFRVPHGRLAVHCYPDTGTFFALWLTERTPDSDHVLLVPREEAERYVPASQVVNHPLYLRAYPKDFLHPDVAFTVDAVTIMVIQLGSMGALLEALGDARALEFVKEFRFAVNKAVEVHGRVVKATDDYVFAAFNTPSDAAHASGRVFRYIARHCRAPEGATDGLSVRMGIHQGPAMICFAHGTNEYFGRTVSLAQSAAAAAMSNSVVMTKDAYQECTEACQRLFLSRPPSGDQNARPTEVTATPRGRLQPLAAPTKALGMDAVGMRWANDRMEPLED